eukprot:3487366-Rhodomonas_salina.2
MAVLVERIEVPMQELVVALAWKFLDRAIDVHPQLPGMARAVHVAAHMFAKKACLGWTWKRKRSKQSQAGVKETAS